ncbi:hypothetical protein N7470_009725 [Penicillium chermesinum]|nr:hypothetical protein N7470_009725 [Penicillium chermesinum]
MKREYLPLNSLEAWAKFNGITTQGTAFQRLGSMAATEFSGLDKGMPLSTCASSGSFGPSAVIGCCTQPLQIRYRPPGCIGSRGGVWQGMTSWLLASETFTDMV